MSVCCCGALAAGTAWQPTLLAQQPNPQRTHLGRLMPFKYRMTLPVSGLKHLPCVVVTGLPQTYTAIKLQQHVAHVMP